MAEPDTDVPELDSFGFDDAEAWLHRFREAEKPSELGSIGNYTLLGELGRGAQGVVYRARQPGIGRDIALKRLVSGSVASARARRRFEREIEAAAALNHPNIVTAYAADAVDGVPLLAMELVDGEPFTAWARGRVRREVLLAFAEVCEAVHHAHLRGVIHRDLKPSNILVAPGPPAIPKVLDFGLARLEDDPEASISGQFVGTPAYAPPEQTQGHAADVDARSDVYALGVVLHEALTGHLPGNPGGAGVSMPRPLGAVLARATAEDREQRYPAVSALAEDIRRFLEGQPVLAQPVGAIDVVWSLARRNPIAASAVVLMAGTLLAASIGLSVMAVRLNEERTAAVMSRDRERVALRISRRVNDYMSTVLLFADPNRVGSDSVTVREVLDRAAAEADASLGADPAAAAIVHQKLGMSFAGLSRFDAAEGEFRKSLRYFRANPGEQGADLVEALRYLGASLISVGRAGEGAECCVEAVRVARGITTGDGSRLVGSLNDLGDARLALGDSGAAESLYRESLDCMRGIGQTKSTKAAAAWRGLGSALLVQRRSAEAAEALTSAHGINCELLGEASPVTATDLANLGQALRQGGDLVGAEQSLSRALGLLSEAYRAGNPAIEKTEGVLNAVREEMRRGGDAARSPGPGRIDQRK